MINACTPRPDAPHNTARFSHISSRSAPVARRSARKFGGHFFQDRCEYSVPHHPFRLYPDLIVHRILKWALDHLKDTSPSSSARVAALRVLRATLYSTGSWKEMATETSEAERRATGAEPN